MLGRDGALPDEKDPVHTVLPHQHRQFFSKDPPWGTKDSDNSSLPLLPKGSVLSSGLRRAGG